MLSYPPQTIISLPVQIAVFPLLADGALVMVVAVQLFVVGLYFPPVLKHSVRSALLPPQIIISVPVHAAVWRHRLSGALVMVVAAHAFVIGLYFPPVFKGSPSLNPPQIIISVPVHTAVC